jgi:hypothetical protein
VTARRWIEYLAAILAGNAIYFLVLFPSLPPVLQHQAPDPRSPVPFRFDGGLVLAFLCCVIVYCVIRLASRHAHRLNQRSAMR